MMWSFWKRVPTLRLLGGAALRMVAIGSELRDIRAAIFCSSRATTPILGSFVQRGAFRIADGAGAETTVGPGTLIGELALVVPMKRPANATALEYSSVIRIARSLFSARAGKRSRRGGPAARRVRRPLEPDRQRHPDRGAKLSG